MIELILDAAATYRLTRLVTADTITQHTRDTIIRWTYRNHPGLHHAALNADQTPGAWQHWAEDDPHAPKLATLITCRWCAGIWLGFLTIALRKIAPRQWRPAAYALTCASAAAWLARLEND
jgi:hypothetical protein